MFLWPGPDGALRTIVAGRRPTPATAPRPGHAHLPANSSRYRPWLGVMHHHGHMAAPGGGHIARPLIGITGYLEPARWSDFVREAVLSPVTYSRSVERAGGIPVVLPPVPIDSVPGLVAGLDGILISCGPDLDPRLYGATRHEETTAPDRRRAAFALALVRAAIAAERASLAVCRG